MAVARVKIMNNAVISMVMAALRSASFQGAVNPVRMIIIPVMFIRSFRPNPLVFLANPYSIGFFVANSMPRQPGGQVIEKQQNFFNQVRLEKGPGTKPTPEGANFAGSARSLTGSHRGEFKRYERSNGRLDLVAQGKIEGQACSAQAFRSRATIVISSTVLKTVAEEL